MTIRAYMYAPDEARLSRQRMENHASYDPYVYEYPSYRVALSLFLSSEPMIGLSEQAWLQGQAPDPSASLCTVRKIPCKPKG